jgi:hypothetical protein
MSKYITFLELYNIDPSFWISEEYFQKAGLIEKEEDGWIWIEDDGVIVFPPLGRARLDKFNKIWSDFSGFTPYDFTAEFLDYEYIYDPKGFSEMRGNKWSVFRKNSRKFPARYGLDLFYEPVSEYSTRMGSSVLNNRLLMLFQEWLEGIKEQEIQDSDVMLKYVLEGQRRWLLCDVNDAVLGLNIWDENYKYLNYRYCLCKNYPFLSEHMRLRFYQSSPVLGSGKLVNDGGVLDNPNLEAFKDKMNPMRKREVYSWSRIK